MAIPTFEKLIPRVLSLLSDGRQRLNKEISSHIASELGLTAVELAQRNRNGEPTFRGRVNWACTYLFQAGLLERRARGVYAITSRGREALDSGEVVDRAYLSRFPEFVEFTGKSYAVLPEEKAEPEADLTPEELISRATDSLSRDLEAELLNRIRSMPPESFESLVVDLMRGMYGGDFEESSEVTGRAGDGGIDGIVKQDRLGFDTIYIQAKKWEGNVSRPEIQKFAGALLGANATYGAFITSSGFTKEAREFAGDTSKVQRIVLIDGKDLVRYMIEYGVGVVERRTIVVKGVDEGYFDGLRFAWPGSAGRGVIRPAERTPVCL